MRIRSDTLNKGDGYAPLILQVSKELNDQFLKSLDIRHERYEELVHPGLLLNFCSITQSPSFHLEDNIAAVAAKFGASFFRQAMVEEKISISWLVSDVYERRSRLYQICEVKVEAETGGIILSRRVNNTFIGGEYLERRVKWEKETGYRRALKTSEFPIEGYEIVGNKKELTMEKLRLFSGGLPGLNWPNRNIHTDREVSIRSGIGRPVASGFMFEAYLVELMVCFFGGDWLRGGELQVIAIDMAGDGDTIVPKGTIHSRGFADLKENIVMDIWCENQYGNRIMVGTASGAFGQYQ